MKKQNNTIFWVIGIVVVVAIVLSQSGGNLGLFSTQVSNPASVYCGEQGGESIISNCEAVGSRSEGWYTLTNELIKYEICGIEGSQTGFCLINGEYIGEWEFYNLNRKDLCESTGGEWFLQTGGGMECECPSELDRDYYGHFNSIKGCILCEMIMFPTVMPQEGYMYVYDYDEEGCMIGRHEELIPKKETVCCKITGVYPGAEPFYKLTTKSYCEEMVCGASRTIVLNSYCENGTQEECLFKLNDFCIKLWMILLGLGTILFGYISTRK